MAVDYEAVKRVVALVMERLDASGPTELVSKLGLTTDVPNAPRLAMNWIDGTNAPRFDYTMTMLSKAGLLTPEADRAWRGEGRAPRAAAQAAAEEAAAAEAGLGGRPRRKRGTG
jgi:hypothetical protein